MDRDRWPATKERFARGLQDEDPRRVGKTGRRHRRVPRAGARDERGHRRSSQQGSRHLRGDRAVSSNPVRHLVSTRRPQGCQALPCGQEPYGVESLSRGGLMRPRWRPSASRACFECSEPALVGFVGARALLDHDARLPEERRRLGKADRPPRCWRLRAGGGSGRGRSHRHQHVRVHRGGSRGVDRDHPRARRASSSRIPARGDRAVSPSAPARSSRPRSARSTSWPASGYRSR